MTAETLARKAQEPICGPGDAPSSIAPPPTENATRNEHDDMANDTLDLSDMEVMAAFEVLAQMITEPPPTGR